MKINSNILKILNSELKAEHFFLIVALFFGTLYSITTPPFRAPDEIRHYMRLYDISTGNLFGDISETPLNVIKFQHNLVTGNCPPTITKWYIDCIKEKGNVKPEGKRYALPVWFASPYTPISYLPAIPIMIAGNTFNTPQLYTLIMSRISLMIASCLIIFYGIKTLPYWKWQTAFFFLFPSQIFIRSHLSADGITIGIALTLISLGLNNNKTVKTLTKTILSSLLAISKYAYFLVPISNIDKKNVLRNIFLFIIIPATLSGFFVKISPDLESDSYKAESVIEKRHPEFYKEYKKFFYLFYMDGNKIITGKNPIVSVNPEKQIEFLKENPVKIVLIGLKTIRTYFLYWIENITNTIGLRNILTFPSWPIYIIIVLMLKNDKTSRTDQYDIIKNISVFVITFSGICAGLYISYNSVGNDYIVGFQGRYLVPIIPLLLVVVPSCIANDQNSTYTKSTDIACLCLLVCLIFAFTTGLHLQFNLYTSFLTSRVTPAFI